MLDLIIDDKLFKHQENKDAILDALDTYFSTDIVIEGKQDELMEILKDEPQIMKLIKDDLEI